MSTYSTDGELNMAILSLTSKDRQLRELVDRDGLAYAIFHNHMHDLDSTPEKMFREMALTQAAAKNDLSKIYVDYVLHNPTIIRLNPKEQP